MISKGEKEEKENTIQPPFLCFSHLQISCKMPKYDKSIKTRGI